MQFPLSINDTFGLAFVSWSKFDMRAQWHADRVEGGGGVVGESISGLVACWCAGQESSVSRG